MTARQLLSVIELRTKVVSLGSFAMGTVWAAWRGGPLDAYAALLFGLAVFLIDAGTTAANTWFDYERGLDRDSANRERDKVLVHDRVAPGVALLVFVGSWTLALVAALLLLRHSGPWLLLPGLAGVIVGWAYNAGRYPLSGSPLGELAAGGMLGTVVVASSALLHPGILASDALLAGIPAGLVVAAILAANNAADREADARHGRSTLAVLLGARGAVAVLAGLCVAAPLSGTLLWQRGVVPGSLAIALASALVPITVVVLRMIQRGFRSETKRPTMRGVLRVYGLFTLAWIVGLAVALVS